MFATKNEEKKKSQNQSGRQRSSSSSDQTKKRNSINDGVFGRIGRRLSGALDAAENFLSGSPKTTPTTTTFFGDNAVQSPTGTGGNLDENLENNDKKSEQTTFSDDPNEISEETSNEGKDKETGKENDNLAEVTENIVTTDSSLVANDSHENENLQSDENNDNSSEAVETSVGHEREQEEGENSITPEEKVKKVEHLKNLISKVTNLNEEGFIEIKSPTRNTFETLDEGFFKALENQEEIGDINLVNELKTFTEEKVNSLKQQQEVKTSQSASKGEIEIEGDNAAPHTANLPETEKIIITELPTTTTGTEIGKETSEIVTPYIVNISVTSDEDEPRPERSDEKMKISLLERTLGILKEDIEQEDTRNELPPSLRDNDNWGDYWKISYGEKEMSIEDFIRDIIEEQKEEARNLFQQTKREALEKLREIWAREDSTITEEERNYFQYLETQINALKKNAIENEEIRNALINYLWANDPNWENYWQLTHGPSDRRKRTSIESLIQSGIKNENLRREAWNFLEKAKKEVSRELKKNWLKEKIEEIKSSSINQAIDETEINETEREVYIGRVENENNWKVNWGNVWYEVLQFIDTKIENESDRDELKNFFAKTITKTVTAVRSKLYGTTMEEVVDEDFRPISDDRDNPSEWPETPVIPVEKTPKDDSGSGGKIAVAILILVVAGAIGGGAWKWLQNRKKVKISEKTN